MTSTVLRIFHPFSKFLLIEHIGLKYYYFAYVTVEKSQVFKDESQLLRGMSVQVLQEANAKRRLNMEAILLRKTYKR